MIVWYRTDTENVPFDEYYDEVTIEKGLQDGTMVKVCTFNSEIPV